MNVKFIDFTGSGITSEKVHLLRESVSYDRAASIVSNAFLNGLIKSGLTLEQAYNVYLSKAYRHKLDWDLEDKLEKVAHKAGLQVGQEYQLYSKTNKKMYGWINDKHRKEFRKELNERVIL